MSKRKFELAGTHSPESWEIWLEGSTIKTLSGPLAGSGPCKLTFGTSRSAKEARALLERLVAERLALGYVEVQAPVSADDIPTPAMSARFPRPPSGARFRPVR